MWPLGRDATYTSPREYREGFWLQDGSWLAASWHYGCDWAAPTGTPVLAAHDGLAQGLNEPGGAGLYVNLIAPGETHRSMYMHLSAYGKLGQVAAGDVIGYVGSTGASTGPHLHFQVHEPAKGWPSVEPVAWLIHQEIAAVPGQVYAWAKGEGLSDAGAAALLGNMRQEAANPYRGYEIDPPIVEGFTYLLDDLVPGVREGIGMIQWSYERRENLLAYARSIYRPWQQPEVQLDFMLREIAAQERYRAMWERVKAATDPVAASQDLATVFIRPGHYGERDQYAADYHARIKAGEFGDAQPLPPPYLPIHLDYYPSALGGDTMTLIIDIEGIPDDLKDEVHPVWEYTGGVLRPFLDASLSGDIKRQKRSWGTFVGLFADYLKINRIGIDGVPVEQQLRNEAAAALAKFNGTA